MLLQKGQEWQLLKLFSYLCSHMETIFDHNITENEERELNGTITRDTYLRFISQKGAYVDLAYLYHMRGQDRKAKKFIEKTRDCNLINSFWRTIKHP